MADDRSRSICAALALLALFLAACKAEPAGSIAVTDAPDAAAEATPDVAAEADTPTTDARATDPVVPAPADGPSRTSGDAPLAAVLDVARLESGEADSASPASDGGSPAGDAELAADDGPGFGSADTGPEAGPT